MLGYANEETEDAMLLTLSTANRLVEHCLGALTNCCRSNEQSPDTADGAHAVRA